MIKDKHVIEALGKAEVIIEDGVITSIGNPVVDYCSIFEKYQDNGDLTENFIRKNITKRIHEFGMCTPERSVKVDDVMSFGTSETLRTNMNEGNIDCVVGACDGVGTLLMTDPDIVQGVGGRVSAFISTTPIPEVIEKVGKDNVLNPETAELNPIKGLKMALERGYKNIAVTIIPSPIIREIREYPVDDDMNIYIFVAHTTSISKDEAKMLFDYADVISGCSSLYVRDVAEEHQPYYSGKKVPLYAVTDTCRSMLDFRLKNIGKDLTAQDYPQDFSKSPKPLV